MVKPDELIDKIAEEIRREIKYLTNSKKTLQFQIIIEFNVSQGGLGDIYITRRNRQKMEE